jgi:hypothetical protein
VSLGNLVYRRRKLTILRQELRSPAFGGTEKAAGEWLLRLDASSAMRAVSVDAWMLSRSAMGRVLGGLSLNETGIGREKSPGELKPIDFKEEMHRLAGDPLTWD